MCEKIIDIGNINIISVGDWNVVQNFTIDTRNYKNKNNVKAQEAVHNLMAKLSLIDIWRSHNPNVRRYTWRRSNQHGRLDYFLISDSLKEFVTNTDILPGYKTDHSLITLELTFSEQERGRGLWKFNSALLHDKDYVALVKKTIYETVHQYTANRPHEGNNVNAEVELTISSQLFFDVLKLAIRGETIPYCARKRREISSNEKDLENEILQLTKDLDSNYDLGIKENLDKKQKDLELLRKDKIDGAYLRSKAKWYLLAEKNNKYFLNLENRHFSDKTISKLVLDDNTEITDIKSIQLEQKAYFEKVYKSEQVNISNHDENLFFPENDRALEKLTVDEKDSCEGYITEAECLNVLKGMSNEKSPGSDGFTVEFFKFFWINIKEYLVKAINC